MLPAQIDRMLRMSETWNYGVADIVVIKTRNGAKPRAVPVLTASPTWSSSL